MAAYLVGLVCPLQSAGLSINVIRKLQGVLTPLLGDSQDWVRLLLLHIILEAGLKGEPILLVGKGGNA